MAYLASIAAIVLSVIFYGVIGYIVWRLFKRWTAKYLAMAEADPRSIKEIAQDIWKEIKSPFPEFKRE